MNRGGAPGNSREIKLRSLIDELHQIDSRIEDQKLQQIVEYGEAAVPFLEGILQNALQRSSQLDPMTPDRDRDWFVVIHALYLLAEIKSEDSLPLVLQFLAQKQDVLDYWLHELLDEDVWEIVFFLGQNQLEKLEGFVLNQEINAFTRLSVCTALIQIGLHQPQKLPQIVDIFKQVLELKEEDPDFTGLLVSELLDLKHPDLKAALIAALKENEVWAGIISPNEVNSSYEGGKVRKLTPLNIFERYRLLRLYTNLAVPSRAELNSALKPRNIQDAFDRL